ncbi:DsbA family oxidoreductase [Aquibacillus koreensis]|uniref:DsbA family oxidoreductase n=2 Tax=Aquibacillus koreensis TaxID=279446 RepID=A0A9X4AJY1_9BACI|nr:DsbA family oxidoreductase [Aquibacillus koreensis]MCT2535480.1 DsbA family oxidoreductase [Aquibacillus koreensis]MDC3422707.1 DsbA family oxidoreductase [Aquibacillus koreensis]
MLKIEVWSDFVCPFCYIGKRRLEMAIEEFAHKDQVEIQYKSFELDSNAPAHTDQHIYDALATKFNTNTAQVKEMNKGLIEQAAEIGLIYNYDEMKPTNTFDAHRLAKYAETIGKDKVLTEHLLHAYFTDSRNVGDIEILAAIAEESGIDRDKAFEVLNDSSSFANEVRNDQKTAQDIGVTGVPYFVINKKYAFSGAQPLETFKSALDQVWEQENPKPQFMDLSGDDSGAVCTDDSCLVPPTQNENK